MQRDYCFLCAAPLEEREKASKHPTICDPCWKARMAEYKRKGYGGWVAYERRVEARRVLSRFPTGEVKETESLGLIWVPVDEEPPEGVVYVSISTSAPEALEPNFRRKGYTLR